MKRVVISHPLEVSIEEAEEPQPGPAEILIRTLITGISAGTEMNLYRGTNPDLVRRRWGEEFVYPMRPGYEAIGEVIECGTEVTAFKPGDRIIGNGKHAQYSTITAERAVKVPDNLSSESASLAIVGRTAMHGVRRAAIEYGDNVAVVGLGLMGQLAIQHARLAGAGRTIAVEVDPWRLEVAERLGAGHAINPEYVDPVERMMAYSGMGADVVLETAGVASAVPLSFSLARDRGRIVTVGWHLKPIPIDLAEDLLYKELDLRPSRGGGQPENIPPHLLRWNGRRNLEFMLSLLAEGRIRTKELITHVLPFEEIKHAYEIIRTRSEPSLHVALCWSET